MDLNEALRKVGRLARPGVLGIAGSRLEKQAARDLKDYFRSLAKRVRALELQGLASHESIGEARSAAEVLMQRAVRLERPTLVSVLEDSLRRAMLLSDTFDSHAGTSLVDRQRAKNDLPAIKEADFVEKIKEAEEPVTPQASLAADPNVDRLGLTGQDASDYAKKHAAELVTGIDGTTVKQMADLVGTGIEEQVGVPTLARWIDQMLDDNWAGRAETIASTEMNDAMSEAALRKMRRLNVQYKQIILSDDACEICQENADEDPLPVDELYSSGDLRAPFHPNCRCATTGSRGPDEVDEP
jgi:hypothetical protein